MSILDLIPESERAAVVAAIVNERPFEPASANEIALRWCVTKLAGTPTVNPDQVPLQGHELDMVREQRDREAEARASALQALAKSEALVREKNRALDFSLKRMIAYATLAERVADWDRHYGTADQQDPALQLALHEARKKLAAIDAEERKP